MSSLIILTERDISDWLSSHNIHPKRLYTDIKRLRMDMSFFRDVHLVIIFIGGTQFNKNQVLEIASQIRERIQSGDDVQFSSLSILSDIVLDTYDDYYRYNEVPIRVLRYSRSRAVDKSLLDFWESIEYVKSESVEVILSDRDKGEIASIIDKIGEGDKYDDSEDMLKLIKKPIFE